MIAVRIKQTIMLKHPTKNSKNRFKKKKSSSWQNHQTNTQTKINQKTNSERQTQILTGESVAKIELRLRRGGRLSKERLGFKYVVFIIFLFVFFLFLLLLLLLLLLFFFFFDIFWAAMSACWLQTAICSNSLGCTTMPSAVGLSFDPAFFELPNVDIYVSSIFGHSQESFFFPKAEKNFIILRKTVAAAAFLTTCVHFFVLSFFFFFSRLAKGQFFSTMVVCEYRGRLYSPQMMGVARVTWRQQMSKHADGRT